MGRLSAAQFKEAEKMPLVIVLDNIRSLNNIGSVFRTSDAFRVESIYLCGISATPPSPEIHKTALGAEDSVDWRYFEDTHQAVKELQERGYKVMAIEISAAILSRCIFTEASICSCSKDFTIVSVS